MLDIVVPTLNEEGFIGALLSSLAKQTRKDFNVYVSDGNSQDKTREIAKSFEHTLAIHVLTSDKRGVAHQRNVGAKAGSASDILFLDADATINPQFIEKFMSAIEGKELANCWISTTSRKPIDRIFERLYNAILRELAAIWPAGGGCGLYTTRTIFEENNGFNEALTFWEDADFIKRAVKHGHKLKFLRKIKVYVSPRRFEVEGRFNILLQFSKGIIYMISTGKIPNEKQISYPMDINYAKELGNKKSSQVKLKNLVIKYTKYLLFIKTLNPKNFKKYVSFFTASRLRKQLLPQIENDQG